jgi:hypothetical protein
VAEPGAGSERAALLIAYTPSDTITAAPKRSRTTNTALSTTSQHPILTLPPPILSYSLLHHTSHPRTRAMSSQRYERVSRRLLSPRSTAQQTTNAISKQIAPQDAEDDHNDAIVQSPVAVPNSPPPSFRSRASSRRPSQSDNYNRSEEERNLHDAFDAPSDDESDDESTADQRRLIQRTPSRSSSGGSEASTAQQQQPPRRPASPQRTVTQIPVYAPTTAAAPTGGRVYGGGSGSDGVWANINAKPRAGEDVEEKPPTYEQAAADATPPYWETTVLSPFSHTGDPNDVFVDGLLVGSIFSFIWNALISMSFQLIGFLLTYLLHTSHAAKHGSRAGLGITLVQYGFQMRYAASGGVSEPGPPNVPTDGVPSDPNSHDFDPNGVGGAEPGKITTADWLSYVLMIVGWFILIRAVSDFMRARRQEALVRSSPDRGLGTAVVAEGETPERSV